MGRSMEDSIFRKSSLERISSPEQLNDYIRIAKPGVWLIMAALLVLMAAVLVWGIFGNVPTTFSITGEAKSGELVCYLSPEDAAGITAGMQAIIGDVKGVVTDVSAAPLSYEEAAALCASDYTIHALQLSDWNTKLTIEADVPDGLHPLTIISENARPISFLTN